MTQLADRPVGTPTTDPESGSATASLVVALRADLELETDRSTPGVRAMRLRGSHGTVPLGELTPGVENALAALARAPRTEAELSRLATGAQDESAVLALQMLLRRMERAGLVEHLVTTLEGPVALLRSVGRADAARSHAGPLPTLDPAVQVKLSRFAVVRAVGGSLRVEAPRSGSAIELRASGLTLLGELAGWRSAAGTPVGRLSGPDVRMVLRLMQAAGVLTQGGTADPADPDADDPEVASAAWAGWSPADLWVHARSQGPALGGGYGGTYPLRRRFAPWPAAAPERDGERHRLAPPGPPQDGTRSSLHAVMSRRRSVREHDEERPITRDQLATLLHRCVHTEAVYTAGDHEVCSRPHPGGGALYELEIHPIVTRCDGLAPGVWHYDAVGHAMVREADPSPAADALVETARTAALMPAAPQVLLVVTARFGRVMWKYEAIAYSLILKHVGVLYQTLYLVATDMGLAPCALGGGDAERFARASGLDYGLEGSVGQFVVGSLPAGRSADFADPTGPDTTFHAPPHGGVAVPTEA